MLKRIIFFWMGIVLLLTGCAPKGGERLTIFAAASLTESLTELAEQYTARHPQVEIVFQFDSSGTLKTQIMEGAACDLFLSAAPRQMNALEEAGLLAPGTRCDQLENKVVLAIPAQDSGAVSDFQDMAQKLNEGEILLAMGNADVPVGQYTQEIFRNLGLEESRLAEMGAVTYCSNVKEVTAQISEHLVDCGIIYATDALAAGLPVAAQADATLCGQVLYPAAVTVAAANAARASDFLEFLQSEEAGAVFSAAGFTPIWEK